jgi:hypothetical protein
LDGPNVARALEGLSVLAGRPSETFVPPTPSPLRAARTCYDHMAGSLAVSLHDRIQSLRWLSACSNGNDDSRDENSFAAVRRPTEGQLRRYDLTRRTARMATRPSDGGAIVGAGFRPANQYDLTREGAKAFEALGIDVDATRALRRHFAYACLDWSERRPHLGGALGAALLKVALERKWVVADLDSRALGVTSLGRRELRARFSLPL